MWKAARFAASRLSSRSTRRFSTAIPAPCIVHKRGADILHDPWFNKQRPHNPVRPIPSQLWCKNFGKKDY